ncbi:MAG: polysaccharide deacetylase family protein [Clostridia bacterium]|nr:polysaccharide deacetylase family protein [Clostridia bacterium]
MIIKLDKFYSFLFVTALVGISMFFALKAENKNTAVSADAYVKVPVLMYHHITENKDKAGSYTVTTDEFEKDLQYIASKGYTAVSVSQLIDYVYNAEALPEKPIVITFDDGFESYQALALPILEKYSMKSAVFIIGSAADLYTRVSDHNISYSNLNWQAIKELQDSPLCEVHSHTYDLHHNEKGERKGMSRLKNESNAEYERVISADLIKLQKAFENKSLTVPAAIAYPYGAYDNYTTQIIKKLGFRVSFTCEQRINRLCAGNKDSLYNLGRYNRESGIKTEEFFSEILT